MEDSGKRKRSSTKFNDYVDEVDLPEVETSEHDDDKSVKAKKKRKREPKVNWTSQEDALLTAGVQQFGSSGTAWSCIAKLFNGTRDAKRCRERWVEYIDPSISQAPFTQDEDQVLLALQAELGNQWKEISVLMASKFPTRSSTGVKSRWHQLDKRQKKHISTNSSIEDTVQELLELYRREKELADSLNLNTVGNAEAAVNALVSMSSSAPPLVTHHPQPEYSHSIPNKYAPRVPPPETRSAPPSYMPPNDLYWSQHYAPQNNQYTHTPAEHMWQTSQQYFMLTYNPYLVPSLPYSSYHPMFAPQMYPPYSEATPHEESQDWPTYALEDPRPYK